MLRIFSSIRQGLLNEGKTSKYFRYAIGEIILVVVGILIALQVNNWNIERAEAKLGQEYIHRLIEDLERDIINIDSRTALAELRLGFGQLLKDAVSDTQVALDNRGEFLAAIVSVARVSPVYLSKDTFEELRSTGYLRLLDRETKSVLFEYFSYYDERGLNVEPNKMMAHTFLENAYKIINFQYTDIQFPVATQRIIEEIREMEVDESLVVETLNRMRENEDLLASLESVYQQQRREIRINGSMRRRAEDALAALKAAQN